MRALLSRTVADCRDIPIVCTHARGHARARTCSGLQCHCRDSPRQSATVAARKPLGRRREERRPGANVARVGGGPIGTSSPMVGARAAGAVAIDRTVCCK